ncbi:hypothetical protein N7E81_18780 [Reichenbachiella carrageenanivorans]|uniref:BNR repeat-containing family member n=1 Tax=Reichenbachiella carrageenanivorans TaxID=2979869 RepID=A0ABY6CZR5_9BACT|nr:hypothetical protein [Reichenbachiella carrageenanivorans]UXX79401.1 hypothetical protein N7E81_18780 [Reichenbachiella carrageenanivorans]
MKLQIGILSVLLVGVSWGQTQAQSKYEIIREGESKPAITQAMFAEAGVASQGENINGPSVIRIPKWVKKKNRIHAKAQYYMYFAHHAGDYIRMAWAEKIDGPWHLYQIGDEVPMGDRGVLDLGDTVINLANGVVIPNNHLASPDVHVDHDNKRIIMYFHSGASTYVNGVRVRKQLTYVSTSTDGLEFYNGIQPVFLGPSYFRVFSYKDQLYALDNGANPYQALDAADPWTAPEGFDYTNNLWNKHPENPFQKDIEDIEGKSFKELRIRHTAVRVVGDELHVFYTRRGEMQERVMMSTIDLSVGDWLNWDATYPPVEVLKPSPGWEGGDLELVRSKTSSAPEDVNQLRDPYVFEDKDGSLYLFYSGRGEDAIGMVRMTYKD